MRFGKISIVALLLLSVSCSSIRLIYQVPVRSKKNTEMATYSFVKSYDVSVFNQIGCWVTGVLWGGACWLYEQMPYESQKLTLINDANKALEGIDGGEWEAGAPAQVWRISWDNLPEAKGVTTTRAKRVLDITNATFGEE